MAESIVLLSRQEEMRILSEITQIMASSELEEAVDPIMLKLGCHWGAKYVSLVLVEEATGKISPFKVHKISSEEVPQNWQTAVCQAPFVPKRLVCIEDASLVDSWKLLAEKAGYLALISSPLISKERVIGLFNLFFGERRRFPQEEIDTLKAVTGYLTLCVENLRLRQEAQRRLMEFSTLADVSKTISSSLDVEEVLNLVVKAAATAMGARMCTLWFVRNNLLNGKILHVGAELDQMILTPWREKIERIVKDFKPLVIEDLEAEGLSLRHLPAPPKSKPLCSFLGVPVVSKGKTIAVLSVYTEDPHRFNEQEINLLMAIANQAAVAIENASLYHRERRRSAQLAMVNEVGKRITSTLDLDQLLRIVVQAICEVFNYYNVAIYLTDDGAGVLKAQAGQLRDLIPIGHRTPVGQRAVGRAIQLKETQLVKDLSKEPLTKYFPPVEGSELSIPLKITDKVIGVLDLISNRRNSFDKRDIAAMEALAGQLASAVGNAKLFNEIKRTAEKLKKANEELENFIFTVSHDLKSPIVSIQGFSTILLSEYKDKLDEEGQHYLERIHSNVSQMERLIHDLLELSRVGKMTKPFEEVKVSQILDYVLTDLQFQLEERGIEFVVPEKLPPIFCDPQQIAQVFNNLITNSIKYIGDTQNPRIEVGCIDKGDHYRFFVKDNGIGIDPKYHQKIFELFQVLKEVKGVEGTGVGLTIVKRIVENHGGRVWVESEKGKGATFYFTIPKTHGDFINRRQS